MSDSAGYVVLAMILAWIGFRVWEGYQRETAKPLPMRDGGNGIMEPVCPRCQSRLMPVQRKQGGGVAGVLALLVGAFGAVLLIYNIIAAAVVIVVALLINQAGKSFCTVLTCPACGQDAKTLD